MAKLAEDQKFLDEIIKSEDKLKLSNDTYAMAFKAFSF
jgi:hypothetical protein